MIIDQKQISNSFLSKNEICFNDDSLLLDVAHVLKKGIYLQFPFSIGHTRFLPQLPLTHHPFVSFAN